MVLKTERQMKTTLDTILKRKQPHFVAYDDGTFTPTIVTTHTEYLCDDDGNRIICSTAEEAIKIATTYLEDCEKKEKRERMLEATKEAATLLSRAGLIEKELVGEVSYKARTFLLDEADTLLRPYFGE